MTRIIVYGYPASPYFQKVLLTLAFCGLDHEICPEPRVLPRPDFESIGITYRRIPLVSIGSELYADTSLIISKLCELAGKQNARAFETFANSQFHLGAGLIPFELINDEAFLKDRSALTGRPWDEETIKRNRPIVASQFLSFSEIVSGMLRQDKFINGPSMSMADVHVLFLMQWILLGHKGGRKEVSPESHREIYQWMSSCHEALPKVKGVKITFDEARPALLQSSSSSAGSTYVEPLGFKVGDSASVTPMDTGRTHPQIGTIVDINASEITLRTDKGAQIHFPRLNYVVKPSKSRL
ncbi:hypothetical protein PYCC9005_000586 [Savitreella phatthalungensis]